MDITVAEKIRLIMKRQNKTMGDIAEASGQTRQNLSNKMTRGNFTEKDILALAGLWAARLRSDSHSLTEPRFEEADDELLFYPGQL